MADQKPGTVIGQIVVTADAEVIRAGESAETEEDES